MRRVFCGLAVFGLCLALVACYEEPVRNHLHIVFAPGAAILVTAVCEIASPESARDNAAVEARLDEARSELVGGWDRWSRGFAELDPIAERTTVERHLGTARRGIRSALLDSFRPLERLLADQGLVSLYDDAAGVRELRLSPAGAGQATRQQRQLVDQALASWSEDVAAYLADATALYAYLDRAPHRAVPCLAHVFDREVEASGPLSPEEDELVQRVRETVERVAEVLLIAPAQSHSVNELSRLVFDCFQGRLTLAVDGPVLESEGLVDHGLYLERPPVDLWRALESTIGKWLTPDLVTAMVVVGPAQAQPEPDPVSFASLPRGWSAAPDAATVESELRGRLEPESVYRVRWQARPGPEDEEEALENALSLLATAERATP